MVGKIVLSFLYKTPARLIPGPKGVINDWRRFKQLETEQRQEQRREMERLIKKLSMTCRSHLDDEADKQKQKELQEKINGKVGWHKGVKMPLQCLTVFFACANK